MSDIEREELIESFRDKAYRHEYVASRIQQLLAAQIRLLRAKEHLSQTELGERAGIQQPQVSRLEDVDKPGVTIRSLERIAEALDVGLVVRLVPFSEIINWEAGLSTPGASNDSYTPLSYPEDGEAQGEFPSKSRMPLEAQEKDQPIQGAASPIVVNIGAYRRALTAAVGPILQLPQPQRGQKGVRVYDPA